VDIERDGVAAGHSIDALKRARKRLGVTFCQLRQAAAHPMGPTRNASGGHMNCQVSAGLPGRVHNCTNYSNCGNMSGQRSPVRAVGAVSRGTREGCPHWRTLCVAAPLAIPQNAARTRLFYWSGGLHATRRNAADLIKLSTSWSRSGGRPGPSALFVTGDQGRDHRGLLRVCELHGLASLLRFTGLSGSRWHVTARHPSSSVVRT
jgi:hypothetical protein